eukprot:5378752-Amphidinium_carterae.1
MWKRSGDVQAFRVERRHTHWHGPCTVIGHHRAKISVNYRGHLWLCSPEQVRPATLEETAGQQYLGDELSKLSEDLATPGVRYYMLPEDEPEGMPEPSTSARLGRPMDVELPANSGDEDAAEDPTTGPQESQEPRAESEGENALESGRGRSLGPSRRSDRERSRTRGRSLWCQDEILMSVMDSGHPEDPDLTKVDLTCHSVSPNACVYITIPPGQDEVKKRKEVSFLPLKKPDQDRFKVAMGT